MNNKSRIVAKKASQRDAVCSDPNYASQSGIIGVKLGAGLLGRPKISLSATYLTPAAESEKYTMQNQRNVYYTTKVIYVANLILRNMCDKSKKYL